MPVKQDHERATLAPILTREDGRVDFRHGAGDVRSVARVLSVAGGALCFEGSGS